MHLPNNTFAVSKDHPPKLQSPNKSENITSKQDQQMFRFIWIALLALIFSASVSVLGLDHHTRCTLPRFFEQFDNSTCTLTYFLEQNVNTTELWAFDCFCTEVGHAPVVAIGSTYIFQTRYVPVTFLFAFLSLILFTHQHRPFSPSVCAPGH